MLYLKWTASLLGVVILWVAVSLYSALSGWWLSSIAPKNDIQKFISVVKDLIQLEKQGNVALVIIESGEVVYEDYSASVDSINRNTLFPLASMSTLFTAYGVMQLIESGKIQLDASISTYLTRWQLPDNSFDNSKVTIRQLLSHTSGLTDGLGFGDF